jgi:flagella basal body P-ring formation protein FlgA
MLAFSNTLRGACLALGAMAALLAGPARAADRPILRGDVIADHDALTLGDLVAGVPEQLAAKPLFRSPALGQTGTIQSVRIVEAAAAFGLPIETGGRLQVLITRASRQIGAQEIEAAVKTALAARAGLDPRASGIVFDGAPPRLVLAPDVKGDVAASDVMYDQRSRRFTANIWVGPSTANRPPAAHLAGGVIEMGEVAIVNRALARGDAIAPGDITVERRPRESIPTDAMSETGPLEGRTARRAFLAGTVLRNGDLVKPELVARGDIVTVTYETPGMVLTMRAKASDAGALGDTISLTNPQSKKVLQGTVIGPGKVSANLAPPGRVATAAPRP